MTQNRLVAALSASALLAGSLAIPSAAHAELAVGAKAPDFTTQGALAGKAMPVNLHKLLRKGPVVLYFYPKAFTQGCTLEAHAFAEATDDFRKAGATVLGMSNDDIETLKKFSTAECRDKFAVAAASPSVIKAYDVDLQRDGKSTGYTKRTSYVIAKSGKVTFVHSDMDYSQHVAMTLAAVKKLAK